MRRLQFLPLVLLVCGCVWAQDSAPAKDAAPADKQAEVSPEIAKAEAALSKSDWKTAEPVLDAWIAGHPNDARALFDAGYAADEQGRNDDAAAFYKRSVAADPNSFNAQISLGLLLARMGKSTEARPALWAATQLDPGPVGSAAKAKAWRALAHIDAEGSNPDTQQASIDLLEALKLSPETPEDTLLAAQLAERNDDMAGATAAYRRALKADPDSREATAGLAHILITQKKYADAEALLTPLQKKYPTDATLTAQLAAVLVAEDKADALPLLEQYHQQHPQDKAMTRMLAQVEADAGNYEQSDQLYVALLGGDPRNADLLAGHGQNLIRLKQYGEAMRAFEAATMADETDGEAWNGLAFASFEMHQPQVTLKALSARSKYLPESPIVLFLYAASYDTLRDKKQAAAYYHRFLESAQGKFPDQEWQARQRLALMEKNP
ncbi:tetratricopeptide repeat protein [Acidicapsa dinghuensis]|uniref:Tetratricopeptide repeat protein n=1 Tax=Acidicapsa dinghuensis TaxID=2218256 RepID=A0ABW1EHG3_9BACT|nr:tetratricopeptide repeat protein [Acidicapsa dinghuensis]